MTTAHARMGHVHAIPSIPGLTVSLANALTHALVTVSVKMISPASAKRDFMEMGVKKNPVLTCVRNVVCASTVHAVVILVTPDLIVPSLCARMIAPRMVCVTMVPAIVSKDSKERIVP